MRFSVTRLFALAFSLIATICLAQTPAHRQDATTPKSENCCECSDPPGGGNCCPEPDSFIGCIVKRNKCWCKCFAPDTKEDSLGSQADKALRILLGGVPSNTTPEQRTELFKSIIRSTQKGNGYQVTLNGASIHLTLQPPKKWKYRPAVYQKPSAQQHLFESEKMPPPRLVITTTTVAPPPPL